MKEHQERVIRMTKGMTQREMFGAVLGYLYETDAPTEMSEFIEGRIAQLDKRKEAGKGKSTKAQREADEFRLCVLDELMDAEGAMTATDIAKAMGVTVQKVSGNLKVLVADGRVTRTEDKGKAYFSA